MAAASAFLGSHEMRAIVSMEERAQESKMQPQPPMGLRPLADVSVSARLM
jgi:hypothetical protein